MNTSTQNNFQIILPAAGMGSRFGSYKQFKNFYANKNLIEFSIEKFLTWNPNLSILVGLPPENFSANQSKLEDQYHPHVHCYQGGLSRAQTVSYGAQLATAEWIWIHDVARPLVQPVNFDNLIKAVIAHPKSAGFFLAQPCVDALWRYSHDDLISINRDSVFLAQTPQIVKTKLYLQALRNSSSINKNHLDDVSVMQAFNLKMMPVKTIGLNFKITFAEELNLAQLILSKEISYV